MQEGLGDGWRVLALRLAAVAIALGASQVFAQAGDSLYESQRLQRALQERTLTIDPQPAGKRIAFVTLARDEVLSGDELVVPVALPRFAPTWPNTFHWLTEPDVIERELLLAEGDVYDEARAEESMRNLRALGIFALVRIVAVTTPDPNAVGLLVYTRDLWSLRLETGFAGTGKAFQLSAQVSERNFLGKNKLLIAGFDMGAYAFSLGQVYVDPRIAGGQLALRESFEVIFNRDSGRSEGSKGALTFERPFRNLQQTQAWQVSADYAVFVNRALRGADIVSYRTLPDGTLDPCTPTAPDCALSVWDDRSFHARIAKTYRHGERYKQGVTFGAGASNRQVAANAETELQPDQESTYARLLPFTRRQFYPFVSYDLWLPNYAVYRNLGTFGQSESVRLGPSVLASTSAPLSAFGSSTNSLTFSGAMGYVLGNGKALAEVGAAASARLENGAVVDQAFGGLLRGATPEALLGRFVLYADWDAQRNDTGQTQIVLGGDNGLRGYESGRFRVVGGSRLRTNIEYRTLPVVIASIHVGGVLFYDMGSVYGSLSSAQFHQSVGAGLRVLVAQFNRSPFCLDFGFPLEHTGVSVLLSYSTEQPVPLTASEDALGASVRPR